ncbi:MAG: dTDP-4-dehydrorhamnose 3,5-epimerase family protein [Pyrinomonadaceae bacterium]
MQPSAPIVEPFQEGEIDGVIVRELRKFTDERGWLAEIFRHDELAEEYYPTMAYISITEPGFTRGPHEHVDQADLFCFIGPSNFKLRIWDRRPGSTYNQMITLIAGEDHPYTVIIPKGVVHAYRNVGAVPGVVINCPNRLYMGDGKTETIDEIRHEDDPDTIYRMDD